MSPSWVHTRRWKSVPTGASGRSKSVSSRAKYAVSCRTASASTGWSSERGPSGRPSAGWRNGENSIATVEPHPPVGEGGGQPDECPSPRAGHRQGGRVGRCEGRGVWEEVRQSRDVGLDGAPVGSDEATGDRAGAGDADLLADDRADRRLVAVDLPGDP